MITEFENELELYISVYQSNQVFLYGFTLTRAEYFTKLRLANLAFKAEVTSDFTNNRVSGGLEDPRQIRKC